MKTARKSSAASKSRSRLNIRMSRVSRILQSEMAKANWSEMAKMLFRSDHDEGRVTATGKLPKYRRQSSVFEKSLESTTDRRQYFLVLMFILTIAEKRSQEVYQREFAERCDAISLAHGLKESDYWKDGNIPAEWQILDKEFEKRSIQILLSTLREYSMTEIADQIEHGGPNEFTKLINNVESQVLSIFES